MSRLLSASSLALTSSSSSSSLSVFSSNDMQRSSSSQTDVSPSASPKSQGTQSQFLSDAAGGRGRAGTGTVSDIVHLMVSLDVSKTPRLKPQTPDPKASPGEDHDGGYESEHELPTSTTTSAVSIIKSKPKVLRRKRGASVTPRPEKTPGTPRKRPLSNSAVPNHNSTPVVYPPTPQILAASIAESPSPISPLPIALFSGPQFSPSSSPLSSSPLPSASREEDTLLLSDRPGSLDINRPLPSPWSPQPPAVNTKSPLGLGFGRSVKTSPATSLPQPEANAVDHCSLDASTRRTSPSNNLGLGLPLLSNAPALVESQDVLGVLPSVVVYPLQGQGQDHAPETEKQENQGINEPSAISSARGKLPVVGNWSPRRSLRRRLSDIPELIGSSMSALASPSIGRAKAKVGGSPLTGAAQSGAVLCASASWTPGMVL